MSLPSRCISLNVAGVQNIEHASRGIPRYVEEHVRALIELAPDAVHSVMLNPLLPLPGRLHWLHGKGLLRWESTGPQIGSEYDEVPLVYHITSPFELGNDITSLWPMWTRRANVRIVVTLYDLIPALFSDYYLRDDGMRAQYESRVNLIRSADMVVSLSQSTADDAVRVLEVREEKIRVIHAGVAESLIRMHTAAEVKTILAGSWPQLKSGFLFYVGGFDFRKNMEALIHAYGKVPQAIRRKHQLVITCSLEPEQIDDLRQYAAEACVGLDELVLTGYVSDRQLNALYRGCDLFIFPSLYEGSGLPVLEAMSCGAPVIASRVASIPELLGSNEGTFDPNDQNEMAQCIESTLSSDASLESLRSRSKERAGQYTWSRVAEETVGAYEELLSVRRHVGPRRRKRLALFTPWPPEESGIADYNRLLVRELSQWAEIDVIVSGSADEVETWDLGNGVCIVPNVDYEYARQIKLYDRILYCMGNSPFHCYIFKQLCRSPGVVVMHDVRLTGFYGAYSGEAFPDEPSWFMQRMVDMYPHKIPMPIITRGTATYEEQFELGIFMTHDVQSHAEKIAVHSKAAADILELDRSRNYSHCPIEILPFGIRDAPIKQSPGSEARPCKTIVSCGVVAPEKGLDTVVHALALLASSTDEFRLVLVGPANSEQQKIWPKLAAQLGVGDKIQVTGRLPEDQYWQTLAQADLAVQLRTTSNGEASAALADCFAARVPTVATDLGWVSELPNHTVTKVPLHVDASELAKTIRKLLKDPQARARQRVAVERYTQQHTFADVAQAYAKVLEL